MLILYFLRWWVHSFSRWIQRSMFSWISNSKFTTINSSNLIPISLFIICDQRILYCYYQWLVSKKKLILNNTWPYPLGTVFEVRLKFVDKVAAWTICTSDSINLCGRVVRHSVIITLIRHKYIQWTYYASLVKVSIHPKTVSTALFYAIVQKNFDWLGCRWSHCKYLLIFSADNETLQRKKDSQRLQKWVHYIVQ